MATASNVDTIATARMKTKSVKMEGALKVCYTGWTKKNWDLKKYVYCSEGHKD